MWAGPGMPGCEGVETQEQKPLSLRLRIAAQYFAECYFGKLYDATTEHRMKTEAAVKVFEKLLKEVEDIQEKNNRRLQMLMRIRNIAYEKHQPDRWAIYDVRAEFRGSTPL